MRGGGGGWGEINNSPRTFRLVIKKTASLFSSVLARSVESGLAGNIIAVNCTTRGKHTMTLGLFSFRTALMMHRP